MTAEMVERRQRNRAQTTVPEIDVAVETPAPARALARVDLVPPIVEARRKQRTTERRLIAGVLALLVMVVVAALAVGFLAIGAENTLAGERTRSLVLINEQEKFTDLSAVKAQLGAYDDAAFSALYSEANWSRLMTELDAVLPAGVELATESIAIQGVGEGAIGIEATGLDAPGVITVSFTANAATFDSPTPLLNALRGLTGYMSATVNAVAASNDAGYLISGVVQLGADALGGTARVDKLDPDKIAQLHDELEIAATTTPAAPTPDDAAAKPEGQ